MLPLIIDIFKDGDFSTWRPLKAKKLIPKERTALYPFEMVFAFRVGAVLPVVTTV